MNLFRLFACCLPTIFLPSSILLGQSGAAGRNAAEVETPASPAVTAKLELVAIERVRDGVNVAWRPDGTLVAIEDAWPETLQVKAVASTYNFIVRLRPSDKPHWLIWQTKGLVWRDPSDRPVEYASVSGKFDSSGTVDLRAGVVSQWGPWLTATKAGEIQGEVAANSNGKSIYDAIKSLTIAGTDSPLVALNFQGGDKPLEHYAWFEIEAMDTDGGIHRRRGVGILHGKQAPYFNLPRFDLASYRFRLRPIEQWIDFKGVPLMPGSSDFDTDVTEVEFNDR